VLISNCYIALAKQVIYLCCAAVLTIRAASTPVVHDAVTTESKPVHPGALATFTLYLQDLTYDASFTVVMLYWGEFSLTAMVALSVSIPWQPCTCQLQCCAACSGYKKVRFCTLHALHTAAVHNPLTHSLDVSTNVRHYLCMLCVYVHYDCSAAEDRLVRPVKLSSALSKSSAYTDRLLVHSPSCKASALLDRTDIRSSLPAVDLHQLCGMF
jgi:hypothetical protein